MECAVGGAYYAGKNLLVTGATGLVGKVLLDAILRNLPEVNRVFVMIRPRTDAAGRRKDSEEVLHSEIIASTAFDFLRARHGDAFGDFVRSKVEAVEGNLAEEGLGMSAETYRRLGREVDVVINSAALAVFDAPLDRALQTNTLGPQRILKFARGAAKRPFVAHISTCYVSNVSGPVFEMPLDPHWTPGGLGAGESFDADEEVRAIVARVEEVLAAAGPDPSGEIVRGQLVREGLRWARRRGWKDTYTFTKAMGEQLFSRHQGEVPALILRPSIIESSLRTPAPGWIDGFRMMDPLIVGFARGRVVEFPGNPEAVLDVVPADAVVNALLMAIPWSHGGKGAAVYQVASGMDRPLLLKGLRTFLVEYFEKKPLRRGGGENGGGRPRLPHLKFPEVTGFLRRLDYRYLMPLRVLEAAHVPLKATPWGRRRHATLSARRSRVEWLRGTAAIYGPYAENQARFLSHQLRPLWEAMSPQDRMKFSFRLGEFDWKHYFHQVHLPGIERYLLRMPGRDPAAVGEGDLAAEIEAAAEEPAETGVTPGSNLKIPEWPDEAPGCHGADPRPSKLVRAEKLLALTRSVRPVDALKWTTPSYKRLMRRGAGWLIRRICQRRLKLECAGLEHIPERGPFIVVANHTSHVDTGVLMTALGPLAHQVHPTAAADYWFRSRFLAWLLHATLGAIPFDRRARNVPKAAALAAQVLRNGHSLIFYPEGSRSEDGQLHEFRSTLGLLALASGAPILPVHITGAAEALPKGESFIAEVPVRVRFGPVRPVEKYLGRLDRESVSDVAQCIANDAREAVIQLSAANIPVNVPRLAPLAAVAAK
jgi:1-acyl-sn-glycerol-3-phosphate acyltransferase